MKLRRLLIFIPLILIILAGLGIAGYYFNEYWISRYDELIERQAGVYGLDPNLIWSMIYEETYFRTSVIGEADEVGLMQVTPAVARTWAKETGLREFEKQTTGNLQEFLTDPERNIQVGCWYLESIKTEYRGFAAEKAMMLAAYNAGPSRVEEWTRGAGKLEKISEREFINLIRISTTRSYVTSILKRYRTYGKHLNQIDPESQKERTSAEKNPE